MGKAILSNGPKLLLYKIKKGAACSGTVQLIYAKLRNKPWTTL